MYQTLIGYIQLTKPRIMLLVIFSGMTSILITGNPSVSNSILIVIALYLTGGSANAFNQYLERHIDAQMKRTNKKRPLPNKQINENGALIFSITIGTIGVLLFFILFNTLSSILALGTILFYSFFYTLYLKPNTPQNIVIGGIAGSMPPLIAWAAIQGNLYDPIPWLLFLVIFLWTPPHFWALALYFKEDYQKTKLPMLPIIKGEKQTLKLIFIYTIILVISTLAFVLLKTTIFYLIICIILNYIFISKAYKTLKLMSKPLEKKLFTYSVIYLFALFTTLIIDKLFFIQTLTLKTITPL